MSLVKWAVLLYNFIWDDFCDWYIEMAKLPLYGEDEAAKKTTRSILALCTG